MREAGLAVDLDASDSLGAIPPGVDLSAYRIAQEALTNVLKHAGGHGLIGMRERVNLFGGRFEAGARDGGGFRVYARLPFEPA